MHVPFQTLTVSTGYRNQQLQFSASDLGGHRHARRVWKDYFFGMDAVVFVVDAADRDYIVDRQTKTSYINKITFAIFC
jgi:signal recognition particle receptor subunit beta